MGERRRIRGEAPARGVAERMALSVLALRELQRAARSLAARGIPALPLKGVLAQLWLYDDPTDRPLTDVDVLVRPGHFEEASRVLLESGFHSPRMVRGQGQVVLQGPTGVALDLHAWPLGPHRFPRFGAGAWLRRARLARDPFDAPLWVPHPEDFYLHLVGKVLLDRIAPGRETLRWEEIARAPRRLGLDAEALQLRASETGLRPALRHAWFSALRSGAGASEDRAWIDHALRSIRGGVLHDGFDAVLSAALRRGSGVCRVLAAYSLETPRWVGWRALGARIWEERWPSRKERCERGNEGSHPTRRPRWV